MCGGRKRLAELGYYLRLALYQLECIPVGCVPSAEAAVSQGCASRGICASQVVCFWGVWCGVPACIEADPSWTDTRL